MEISLLLFWILVHTIPILAELTLGSLSSYAALSLSSITNTGPSIITGDVGTHGSSITGFPPGIVTENIQVAVLLTDAQAAYDTLSTYTGIDLSSQDLGNKVLEPGTYTFTSEAQLTGLLTLSSTSSSNHSWYFVIGTALTVSSSSQVLLAGTARACNVYWRVGSSATIGVGTQFVGNVLAGASVTLNTGASCDGALFGLGGAVTLDTNEVSVASCGAESFVETTTIGNSGVGGVGGVGGVSTMALVGGLLASTSTMEEPMGPTRGVLTSTTSTRNISTQTPSLPPNHDTYTTEYPPLSTPYNEVSPTTAITQDGVGLQNGNLGTVINTQTLPPPTIFPVTTTSIPEVQPTPTPFFPQPETENEIQFPTPTQIQIAASMLYNSIEAHKTVSQTLNNPYNTGLGNPDVIDAPQTLETSHPKTGGDYPVLVTIIETFFSTIPCTLQHYGTTQNQTTMTNIQEGSGDTEIITIISSHIITTTCTLPHITSQGTQNGRGGKVNHTVKASEIKTYDQVGPTPSPGYSYRFRNTATRNGVGWCCVFDLVLVFAMMGVY